MPRHVLLYTQKCMQLLLVLPAPYWQYHTSDQVLYFSQCRCMVSSLQHDQLWGSPVAGSTSLVTETRGWFGCVTLHTTWVLVSWSGLELAIFRNNRSNQMHLSRAPTGVDLNVKCVQGLMYQSCVSTHLCVTHAWDHCHSKWEIINENVDNNS